MMADSGSYTPETIARRYAMAQQLLADPKQPVRHWAQGLDELAKGALGGYQFNRTENLERQSRADANAQGAAALGLPAPAPIKSEPSGFEKVAALFRPQSAAPDVSMPAPDVAPPMATGSVASQPSTGNVPASVRFNNPGAQWPGPSADKFGSTGSGVIGGGNKIAQFPDPVSGAAAQFDLLGRKYAGMPLNAAIAKWSGNNNAPQYAAAVSQATGLPPDTPITPELLKNPAVAIPLAKAMAKVETGRDYPMSDAQWQQAHAMAFNGSPAPGSTMPPMPARAAPANATPSPQDLPQASQPTAGVAPGILGSPAPGNPAAAPASAPAAPPAVAVGGNNRAAMAAALSNPWTSPGIQQALIGQIVPKPQAMKIQNRDGSDAIVFVDPVNKTVTDATGKPFDAAATGIPNPGLSGDDYLKTIPAGRRELISGMLEGRIGPAQLGRYGTKQVQSLLEDAARVEPNFDLTTWKGREAGIKDFYGGGKSQETGRRLNQSALHFSELIDKMAELPGHQIPAVNAAQNFVNTQLLGKGNEHNFEVNAHALADELAGIFKGAGISDTEIRAWESRLSPNMSDEQQRGMAKTLNGLYRDAFTSQEKKRQDALGPKLAARHPAILGPDAENALTRVEKFSGGQNVEAQPLTPAAGKASPPTVQTAPIEKTINGKTYFQQDGKWFEK